ncbi:MAG: UDP-glucose 4-epimerase GalE [Nanoarchaeota archaeon]
MRLLVTGGAGYIGSICTAVLLDRGHSVTVLDTLENGHREAVDNRARLIIGSTGDPAALKKAFSGRIDAVLHFAGYIEVGESVLKPKKYLDNNVGNGKSLLAAMKAHGVNKIVFSSTAAVYGKPAKVPVTEAAALKPINPYGISKLQFERLIAGMQSISLRYFNAAGAIPGLGEDHHPETHLIPRLLKAIMQSKEFTLYGEDYPTPDGSCVRDYIHVEDLARAHLLALEALGKGAKGAYNLGTGEGYSVLEVIKAAEKVTGKKARVIIGKRRAGDPPVLVASAEKIRKDLGWKPRHGLKSIISSAWDWHRSHPDGYDS